MSLPPIYIIGRPGTLGGANTQLWATMRLWREVGNLEVHLIPPWGVSDRVREMCEPLGVILHDVKQDDLLDVPGLAGSPVLGMCNKAFLNNAGRLRDIGCQLIWSSCMCWMFDSKERSEVDFYKQRGPFDIHHFQSDFQFSVLWPRLQKYGVPKENCHVIHGAFVPDEYPFEPQSHMPGSTFYIGRLCRDDLDKWSSNIWKIYNKVAYPNKRARVMGWAKRTTGKCGKPPQWAEALATRAETTQDFLRSLHAMVPINGGAKENWPRVGLEAMSMGVPLVTQNAWGWRNMIRHGKTGFLCDNHQDFSYYLGKLAREEEFRMTIATNARRQLTEEHAAPDRLWDGWSRVFQGLNTKGKSAMAIPAMEPELPFLSCLCCTYCRPELLEEAIYSFTQQDYPADRRELIVLDDANQYHPDYERQTNGPNWKVISLPHWKVISLPRRFRTLGEKRNALAGLALPQADGFVVWDDDDIYLPHTLRAHAAVLKRVPLSIPSKVWKQGRDGTLVSKTNNTMFHGSWAFTPELFHRAGRYAAMNSGEDKDLLGRMLELGIKPGDPTANGAGPYYIYRYSLSGSYHLSAANNPPSYESLAILAEDAPSVGSLRPHWKRNYTQAREGQVTKVLT